MALKNHRLEKAFSLVEVVIAIAIVSFALIAILGLFTTGLRSTKESEQQIQAANLASTLISLRTASPTNDIVNLPKFAIPSSAMTNAYPSTAVTTYVGADGQTNTTAANALYLMTYQAGTNSTTGTSMAQVYMMLSWPPQATSSAAVGRYELITVIPIR